MSDALSGIATPTDPNLLVGFETSDDAAVYRLSDDIAVISTIDFITPPVDDPYWFGQIAAANAISDVYSMGGRPFSALNVVMFPSAQLDSGLLREILRGGSDKVSEAGASLAGGHSVDDKEPKYGLSVCGTVHPDRIVTNTGARPGDALILTKPLGSGVLFNAVRSGKLSFEAIEKKILPILATLNRNAIEQALKFDLHACTDVTGFGLTGHALEMAHGSRVKIGLRYRDIPFFSEAHDMYKRGETTGSNRTNRELAARYLDIRKALTKTEEELLYDPQTSGGLLLAVPAEQADKLMVALTEAGVAAAARIGEVMEGGPGLEIV